MSDNKDDVMEQGEHPNTKKKDENNKTKPAPPNFESTSEEGHSRKRMKPNENEAIPIPDEPQPQGITQEEIEEINAALIEDEEMMKADKEPKGMEVEPNPEGGAMKPQRPIKPKRNISAFMWFIKDYREKSK